MVDVCKQRKHERTDFSECLWFFFATSEWLLLLLAALSASPPEQTLGPRQQHYRKSRWCRRDTILASCQAQQEPAGDYESAAAPGPDETVEAKSFQKRSRSSRGFRGFSVSFGGLGLLSRVSDSGPWP